jgi:nucleotide-binding universal stress UspA family protein
MVAVDASPSSLAALEAAVEFAARFRAELLGLFIEDINLLRLAQLPFAQEVGLHSALRRRLDTGEVERQLRTQVVCVRRAFTELTERAQVRRSFRVVRGRVTEEILRAGEEADIVILGRSGWSVGRQHDLGSTARAVVSGASCLALVVEHGMRVQAPIVAVYDGAPAGQRALRLGARLGREHGGPFRVLILGDGMDRAEEMRDEAREVLREYDITVRYHLLTESNVAKIVDIISEEPGGTLLVPARGMVLHDEAFQELVDELNIPVLVVR